MFAFLKSKKGPCTTCSVSTIIMGVLGVMGALFSIAGVYNTTMIGGTGSDEQSLALLAMVANLFLVMKVMKTACPCQCVVPTGKKK